MTATAWSLIGIVPWIILVAIALPGVVTGRRFLFDIPTSWPPGWRLRLFGLFCLATSSYMVYDTLAHGALRQGIFISWVAMTAFLIWAIYRARKFRKRSAAGAAALR